MTQPACMTDHEYVLWSKANRSITSQQARAKTPCRDCPLAFARDMLSEGCCDGTPGTAVGRPRKVDTDRRRQWRAASQRRRDRRRAA